MCIIYIIYIYMYIIIYIYVYYIHIYTYTYSINILSGCFTVARRQSPAGCFPSPRFACVWVAIEGKVTSLGGRVHPAM